MTVTQFIRNSPPQLAALLGGVAPSFTRRLDVAAKPLPVTDPAQAGRDFARLCVRMKDSGRLPPKFYPYLPWLRSLRDFIRANRSGKMEVERRVGRASGTLEGFADIVRSGSEEITVVEVKVACYRAVLRPELAHIAQLAAYCDALSMENPDVEIRPVIAIVELSTPAVRWHEYRYSEIVDPVRESIRAAA